MLWWFSKISEYLGNLEKIDSERKFTPKGVTISV